MIYTDTQLGNLFDGIFGGKIPNSYYKTSVLTKNGTPENYEVSQSKDGAYLFFEAPGFNKSNLKVEIENGILSIKGQRTYVLNDEKQSKSIEKEFKLGSEYDPELIEATIEDGLLTIFVPGYKKKEKKKISLL